ncbi:hypothetical protein EVAR_25120_1 [Eumeta japonica]|uniref:Uncharacterized protein n=1 Tax=Eumeta variegata TaxID=151549 RepID=A0A4C1XP19_EUMVA|nr:hypothetical protein EVAR_25120_1 [Eumeta japonica]
MPATVNIEGESGFPTILISAKQVAAAIKETKRENSLGRDGFSVENFKLAGIYLPRLLFLWIQLVYKNGNAFDFPNIDPHLCGSSHEVLGYRLDHNDSEFDFNSELSADLLSYTSS